MGQATSAASHPVRRDQLPAEVAAALLNPAMGVAALNSLQNVHGCCLSRYTIFQETAKASPQWQELQHKMAAHQLGEQENRAIGVMVGLAIGDAVGAPLEFAAVQYNIKETKGLDDEAVWETGYGQNNRFMLKPGMWTDDTAMSLCLADSLLINGEINNFDLRMRFLCWWELGYNNAFGWDNFHPGSVGLGGNIAQSFAEFTKSNGKSEFTTAGNKHTSGNGSLMRLGPVCTFYHSDTEKAMSEASKQSLATHQGEEAAECCRLLAFVCTSAIQLGNDAESKQFLKDIPSKFKSPLYSVSCLAASKEEEDGVSEHKTEDLKDRNWNWKMENYRYSPTRAQQQPGYVGSYAMDCLSMSLHCIWSTNSAAEAVLKAANMRGDADTVAAVTGQIAGAVYGVSAFPQSWIKKVQQWDSGGRIAFTASCLFSKNSELLKK